MALTRVVDALLWRIVGFAGFRCFRNGVPHERAVQLKASFFRNFTIQIVLKLQ